MEIYPKIVAFCPKSMKEQDANKCLSCEYFKSHKVNAKKLFIDCQFVTNSVCTF